ncbi:hypothetical protein F5148DRAFT_162126 [Russula earlei]|uniref:Uncharacterized protein n=1 Tax=Russula earlei TaxID=71964 RepID=A0ACC0U7D4_9AGAM|nr:hypothetical protein F5148DRAFT_162126 [Russula earlei]
MTQGRVVENVALCSHGPRCRHADKSFMVLSSYSSESDLSTLFDYGRFKSKSSRPRRKSPGAAPPLEDRGPSPARRTRRKQRSVTPTRTPASSFRYERAIVPYSFRSPGNQSGISYSDIDRWRAATISGSDFTFSSESSITQSSVTSPSSVVSSSRYRAYRVDNSSRPSAHSTASGSRQLKAPSVASQHPHPGVHDTAHICEHCCTP